jgi:hypothetical protein
MKREDCESINNTHEPKCQNRFIVEFPREFGIQEWLVSIASKPKYILRTYDFKGNTVGGRWEDMMVTFKDPIGPSSTKPLYQLIKLVEELKKITLPGLPLFTYKIFMLDPTGITVETWEIGVQDIISIEFGENLDYSSDEFVSPKITMRPLYCLLHM